MSRMITSVCDDLSAVSEASFHSVISILRGGGGRGEEGVLSEKLAAALRAASQNPYTLVTKICVIPYSICDLTENLISYL